MKTDIKPDVTHWWMRNNLRLIQSNLRETDAQMDVDRLINNIKDFEANTLMIGAGGIAAFYPTKLKNQYTSPCLTKDLLGEVVDKCHKEDIRVIARFDFSKAHISFYDEHPDWFYRSLSGEPVNFNDMVHTCVNGAYQRGIALDILREVLEKYPVDGIFFNMLGYQTRDYSERYHGICQCCNCKKRFSDMYHLPLPRSEECSYINKYEEFKKITVGEILDSIHSLVKSINPEIAICTYTDYRVDIIRNESNSALSRPLPFWIYSASDNVMSVEGSFPDKTVSNCAINAADIFYRFMGVSKYLTKIRLLESMAAGSGLDYCIIGVFSVYPETEPFDEVKKIFHFHKNNEIYFGQLESLAEILLIKPDQDIEEYRGIFKMLKESHYIFDVVEEKHIPDVRNNYRWVIAPSVVFDPAYFSENTNILATSSAFYNNELREQMKQPINGTKNETILKSWFGAEPVDIIESNKGAYLSTDDKTIWKRFPLKNQVILDDRIILYSFDGLTVLPYLPPARYAPPERCGGTKPSGFGAVGIKDHGQRICILAPWRIGSLYYKYGYQEHRDIILDLMDYAGALQPIYIKAPEMVEVFYSKCPGGKLIQLVNLTGFNGTTFFSPLPVNNISVCLKSGVQSAVIRLRDNTEIQFRQQDGTLYFSIDALNDYEAILIKEDN